MFRIGIQDDGVNRYFVISGVSVDPHSDEYIVLMFPNGGKIAYGKTAKILFISLV